MTTKAGANFWLMKSEPDVFSFDDLVKAPKRTTSWEGVRNYQARNFMRDEIKVGDGVLFYHSNADVTGIAGIAEVVRGGYPDTTAIDPKHAYYDEKTKGKTESPWVMVDVKATMKLARVVTRPMLAGDPKTKKMKVLQKGSRLSVQPVTKEEFEAVCRLGSAKPV